MNTNTNLTIYQFTYICYRVNILLWFVNSDEVMELFFPQFLSKYQGASLLKIHLLK